MWFGIVFWLVVVVSIWLIGGEVIIVLGFKESWGILWFICFSFIVILSVWMFFKYMYVVILVIVFVLR